MRSTTLWPLAFLALIAFGLLGCTGTSAPPSAAVIGDRLPGAQGLTLEDQERIDDTVARGCAAGLYVREKCDVHTVASAARRAG